MAAYQTPVPVTITELTRFCREGLYSELRYAIYYEKDMSAQLNTRTQRGNTLLHEAAEHDYPDIVQLLLLHGCPPNVRSKGGLTPLHVAAAKGHMGCVRALLENDADVTLRDDLGQNAFMKAERSKKKDVVQRLLTSREIVALAAKGDVQKLEKRLNASHHRHFEVRDLEEALLTAIRNGNDDVIPLLIVSGARRLDCALYLAIQLERVKSIAMLLLCKATITGDCHSIRSLLSEPPDSENTPWYMKDVYTNMVDMHNTKKMSYPIAVSIMEKNYEATKELLLKTDLDMRRKQVEWSKLKLTLLHPSWMYSIAPWVVSLKLVNNHLRKLPEELFKASQLRRLDLSQNLLESVQANLLGMPNLEYLNLSHNHLKELPETENWSPQLLSLDLTRNSLHTLPNSIQHSSLEILILKENQFTSVPRCLCRIRTLTSLDLSHMPISALPKEMENLEKLVNLNVTNANIKDLPVLPGKVRGFFKARARSSKPCNYVKVVILCQSDVAKSVMYSRLRGAGSSTFIPDIGIFQWSYRPLLKRLKLHFNTWVLGSSTDYSPIFPCFFSPCALYLIIWDMTRTGEMREQIKLYVDLLARYVPAANILVMVILPEPFEAWADANFENLTKRLSQFFSKPIYRTLQYHGIGMMSVTNAVRDTAQVDVKQKIYEIASTMMVNGQLVTGRHVPENYFSLISIIDKEQQVFRNRGKPGVLEENALWNLFERALPHDSPDRMELPVIVDFLQEAGLLLHYPDPNHRLDQYYFVRPEWLFATMFRVLHHSLQHSERVTISYTELCSLADLKWSQQMSKALIRLMVRYAIVLPIKTEQQLLIPHLLPHCAPPSSQLLVGSLRRQFAPKTKALPADLWYRVICRILASLHRVTEMKTLKKKNGPLSSKKSSESAGEQDDPPERPVETDEETDEQAALKHKNIHFKRGPSAPFLSIESDGKVVSTAGDVPKPREDTVSATTTPQSAITTPESGTNTPEQGGIKDVTPEPERRTPLVSPDVEIESSLDHGATVLTGSGVEVCPLPDEMETCVLIPPESLTDVTQPGPTDVRATHPLSEAKSRDYEQVGLKLGPREAVAAPDPTMSLPALGGHTQALDIPRKQDDNIVGTSLSPSTLLIENNGPGLPTGRTKPTQTFSADSTQQPSRMRVKRVKSMPPKHRGSHSMEPALVDRGVKVWNTGLIYDKKDITFSVFPCSCEMSSVEERGIEICATKNTKGRIVMARLCKLIQNLLQERYPDLFSVDVPLHKHELTQLAICPICIEKKQRNPTNFLVETCVHTLKENENQHCRYHPETVPLRDLVPDYLIVDFPSSYNLSADSFEFNQSRPLHRSISASLYNGKIRGQEVAVKMNSYSDGRTITGPLSYVRQEMEMLFHLKHPNIVRTFGFCLSPPCVLLEKAPMGNLQQKLMDTEQRVSRAIRFHIGCQVASALEYLHRKEIIYRTLKASSILVWSLDFADEVNVKLTNFDRAECRTPSGLIGKPNFAAYHAPEMLRYSFKEEYTEKVDIYSFGMLLYELVTRWHPFGPAHNAGQVPIFQRPKMMSVIASGYSTMTKLMQECWNEDQTERPTALFLTRTLSHPATTCHIATSALRDCISVRGCCYVPSVHQIWVYGEYNRPKQVADLSSEASEGTQVFIVNAQTLSVQGSLELKESANSIHAIDNKVWIGMTESCVHAYDTTTFTFTDRVYVNDSVTSIIDNETFVFIAQANGLLTYYPKLKFPKESRKMIVGSNPIMSMILVGESIWLACGNEIVVVATDDDNVTLAKRWSACESDQIYTLVYSKDLSTVWSLVRLGSTITSWDSNTGSMKQAADYSQELKIVCCDLILDPSYVRMSSMECVLDTLWVGLSCGAIVILSAADTPRVLSAFKAHKNTTKCLMEIPQTEVEKKDCAMILSGGYGEVSFISNVTSESNGVVMSWEALSAKHFKCIASRYHKYYTNILPQDQ
jgi:serine/threonine protein kinase